LFTLEKKGHGNNMIIDYKKESIEIKNINKIPEIGLSPSSKDDLAVIFCSIVTTSLNNKEGDVLRVNLKLSYINKDGNFSKVRKTISFFEDPKRELSIEESKFLDFSIEEKNGSTIDWNLVNNLLNSADLVISHNASFVKPWIAKHIENLDTIWGCSMEQANWEKDNFPSRSLPVLSVFSGLFYDQKDSALSLDALVHVLVNNNATKDLIIQAKSPDLQLFAANAPFESKDILKERRYRWNPDVGCWWLAVKDKEHGKVESEWLVNNFPKTEPQIFEIEPKFRF